MERQNDPSTTFEFATGDMGERRWETFEISDLDTSSRVRFKHLFDNCTCLERIYSTLMALPLQLLYSQNHGQSLFDRHTSVVVEMFTKS